MKKQIFSAIFAMCLGMFGVTGSIFAQDADNSEKNIADVEFRVLPNDYENLLKNESEKWDFNFRPYGSEAAAVLWSDPNAIRSIIKGEKEAEKNFPTAMYVSCDCYGISVLVFGAVEANDLEQKLKDGKDIHNLSLECYFLPGDADNPQIINYQPFGISSSLKFQYGFSWMKNDRHNRPLIPELKVDSRRTETGIVMKIFMPWTPMYDHLPFLSEKKDCFWRLSMIRWDKGGVTWGGVVHQQIGLGYLRFHFTEQQKTAIMKNILLSAWQKYQTVKNSTAVDPGKTCGRNDYYRANTLEKYPHSYMNVNEDWGFRDSWLINAIKERDDLGIRILNFEKMPLDVQKSFYLQACDKLMNFQIDIDKAWGEYHNQQIMQQEK